MADDIAFRSQEFAADRSREANAYRMAGAESMQQGLSSLVPMYQQARQNQIKAMQSQQEIAMDELRRQEAVQTLQFTQEVHRTAMIRATTEDAIARANLSVAQSRAAMEKLSSEGYQKLPMLNEEEMEGILAGGWKVVPGGARGLGRVEEASKEEVAAAKAGRSDRKVMNARVEALQRYESTYGGVSPAVRAAYLRGEGELPKAERYAPTRETTSSLARDFDATINGIEAELEQIKRDIFDKNRFSAEERADMARRQTELRAKLEKLNDRRASAMLGEDADEETAGFGLFNSMAEAAMKALYPSGGR